MSDRVHVSLDASRYARALSALWHATNCWYKAEAELVQARQTTGGDPHVKAASELLASMQESLLRVRTLLTTRSRRRPARK